jgi:hypothetical protein
VIGIRRSWASWHCPTRAGIERSVAAWASCLVPSAAGKGWNGTAGAPRLASQIVLDLVSEALPNLVSALPLGGKRLR